MRGEGSLVGGVLDAALPQTCAACGEWMPGSTGSVCAACQDEVAAALDLPYCYRCGRTLPPPALHDDGCARCKIEPYWNVAGVARVGLYPHDSFHASTSAPVVDAAAFVVVATAAVVAGVVVAGGGLFGSLPR